MESTRSLRIGSRLLRRCAAALTVVVGAVTCLSFVETDPDRISQQPVAWAQRHKSSLPTTLTELAAYPLRYRADIFRELPVGPRLQMVQEHLKDLLATRHDLSAEQRAYLQSLVERLSDPVESQRLIALPAEKKAAECQVTKALFPDKALRDTIGDNHIGDYTKATYSVRALALRAAELGRTAALAVMPDALRARGTNLCNCNADNGVCDCDSGVKCKDVACTAPEIQNCTEPWVGCLFTNHHDCTGRCANSEG